MRPRALPAGLKPTDTPLLLSSRKESVPQSSTHKLSSPAITAYFLFPRSLSNRWSNNFISLPALWFKSGARNDSSYYDFFGFRNYANNPLSGYGERAGFTQYGLPCQDQRHWQLARLEDRDSHEAAEVRKRKPRGIRHFCKPVISPDIFPCVYIAGLGLDFIFSNVSLVSL